MSGRSLPQTHCKGSNNSTSTKQNRNFFSWQLKTFKNPSKSDCFSENVLPIHHYAVSRSNEFFDFAIGEVLKNVKFLM